MRSRVLVLSLLCVLALAIGCRFCADRLPTDATELPPEPNATKPVATVQPGGRCRVQVLDQTGQPAAGAEVRYWPPRTADQRVSDQTRLDADEALEAALRTTGRIAKTDASGFVDLIVDQHSFLHARRGDACARAFVSGPEDGVPLDIWMRLHDDVTLRIEVVDELGAPVPDVKVEHTSTWLSPSHDRRRGGDDLGDTDAAGIVLVRDALQRLRCPADATDGSVVLHCDRRTSDASEVTLVAQTLSRSALRGEVPVRLTLASSGSIVVTCTDAAGERIVPQVWLCDAQGRTFEISPFRRDRSVWFRNVPPGQRWVVCVRPWGCDLLQVPVAGPARAHEVTAVAVPVPTRTWELRGRVVWSDGEPIADAGVECRCSTFERDPFPLQVDDAAHLRHARWFVPDSVQSSAPMTLRVETPFGTEQTLAIQQPLHPGTNDLGDLVIQRPPGATRLARVELRCAGVSLDERSVVRLYEQVGDQRRELPTMQHRRANHIELVGVPPHGAMELACDHPACWPPVSRPVRVGEDVVVEMRPAASLHLLVTPLTLPDQEFQVTLARTGLAEQRPDDFDDTWHAFVWRRLEPGQYRLQVGLRGQNLHEQVLELHPGAQRWPADGTRLDLAKDLVVGWISARSTVPGELPAIDSLMVAATAAELPPLQEGDVGSRWFRPRPGHDLLVRASGYVPVRVPGPPRNVQLTLQPATRMKFESTAGTIHHVRVQVLDDAIRDPLLRAFDVNNRHAADTVVDLHTVVDVYWRGLWFVPGTVVELAAVRNGVVGEPCVITIGTTSPQRLLLP